MNTIKLFLLILVAQIFSFSTIAQETQKAELYIETGHTAEVVSLAFSPDGKTLISSGGDGSSSTSDNKTIKLWDVASGRELKTLTTDGKVT